MTRSELVDFMRRWPLVVAASVSPARAPQAALLGVAVSDQLEIVFDTVDTSRKFRNLRSDSRIALVFGAAGAYTAGSHDERTLQYEGTADVPTGEELRRVQETIYFRQFPDGRSRLTWPGITYVHARPTWIRYSDYNRSPSEIFELSGDALRAFLASI
ncbi:MAG TPA: pyridoxamine 5'-phosphate oxidase family protein [Candidatus Acidoferrales bacterium]|nr:pyridoxamine 5'-phosphate oxidase family protein [Candidatus Acidoferrales bacterium]